MGSTPFGVGADDRSLGIIAGSGIFPLRVAESARRSGLRVVAVALDGETDPSIERHCDDVTWVKVGQLGKMVKAFHTRGVGRAAMAGGVKKARLFDGLRPDLHALKLLPKVRSLETDQLLRAIASAFEDEGIEIVDPLVACPALLSRPGVYGRRRPDAAMEADFRLGYRIAKSLGAAEAGQTVCVKSGMLVAIEAMEGTDRCIRRAGELAGKGVVVVKVAMPSQDTRFDAPCIGPETIRTCLEIGAAAVAFESGKTVMLDEGEVVEMADAGKLAVVGLPAEMDT
ncbi:LpxI family protein [Vulgatibacter incomptus]|uniref:UDP-2,3-diacylglucosamine pyrophosphatase n=1 Tax=Vulgatibacter incomptus TaxID=1391653 RepID=A0A0K1PD37_9BACT|nr:UDP-2,3-diacylglucosamine diphosphatase LpxI [Vulgatibacter incomptus]AKU91458.1 UDP-2,3-diacylglucosamine pyrophosphatase [Vulgatibacter incomptus]